MAGSELPQALAALIADVSLWSGAPAHAEARAISQAIRALHPQLTGRPALRAWQEGLARWFAAANEAVAEPEQLVDAALASLQWAEGADARDLGLEPAIQRVLKDLGVPPAMAARLLDKLAAEAVAAAPAQPAGESAAAAALAGDVAADAHADIDAAQEPRSLVASEDALAQGPAGDIDDPAPPGSDGTGPIWLAPQERDMLLESIHGDLLPQLSNFSLQTHPRTPDDALSFLLEAQRNALAVVGLPHTAALLALAEVALTGGAGEDPVDTLALWFVALGEWLGQAHDLELRAAFEECCAVLGGQVGAGDLHALQQELARLTVGQDPLWLTRARREVGDHDLDLSPASDVIPAVLQGMLRELPGHAEGLSRNVAAMLRSADADALAQARRIAHTLKGDANTVGVRGLANLTHALEDILTELERRGGDWPAPVLALLEEASDGVAAMADHLLGRGAAPADSAGLLARVYAVADALERDEAVPEFADVAPAVAGRAEMQLPDPDAPAPAEAEETIALPRSVLDRLLRLSGESMALANQLRNSMGRLESAREELLQELNAMRQVSQQLDEQVGFRGAALADRRRSALDVDPLELDQYNELYVVSRRVHETWADARARLTDLESADQQLEALVQRKLRVDEDLQTVVRRSRLVPIRETRARFDRAVRQAARMVGKSVQFEIHGDQLAIDKLLLDALVEPLMHLLRNAVDHGIEDAGLRQARGKAIDGHLTLQFSERAQSLEVAVIDDGGGLDLERIRARGLRLGLIDAAVEDPEQLKALLFKSGFSTRDEVTQISGRGVGLDVVARRLQALGGHVRVESLAGAGSRFELRIPLTLGTLQVALVAAHGHAYALATDGFAGFVALSVEQLRSGPDGREALVDERWVAAVDFGTLLGQRAVAASGRALVGALIDLGEERRVVLVEQVDSLSLVVLESLSRYLPPIRGVRGACVLGDGRVAPVLDLRELWRGRQLGIAVEADAPPDPTPVVVVADDSLTIRRALGDLLIDAGYRVELARDGLEALMQIERQAPAALLVDLEMPRMNGLELTAHLRKDPRYAELPIIMITSRTAGRHQQLALDAGVSAVLGKPYSDDDVLAILQDSTSR